MCVTCLVEVESYVTIQWQLYKSMCRTRLVHVWDTQVTCVVLVWSTRGVVCEVHTYNFTLCTCVPTTKAKVALHILLVIYLLCMTLYASTTFLKGVFVQCEPIWLPYHTHATSTCIFNFQNQTQTHYQCILNLFKNAKWNTVGLQL